MSQTVLWVFYDSLSKIQSTPVSTEEAQTTILKMGPQQIDRFYIWTTGWNNWQQLKAYLESDQKKFVSTFTVSNSKPNEETITATIKCILEKTNSIGENENSLSFSSIHLKEDTISRIVEEDRIKPGKSYDIEEITWSNIQKPNLDFSKVTTKALDKREARHDLKIEILLISPKGKTFRSRSKNISLSGSLLEDTIPFDYYDTSFDIVIINNKTSDPLKARVKLSATAVRNNGGLTQRIQYENPTEAEKKSLKMLLEDYKGLQKKPKAA